METNTSASGGTQNSKHMRPFWPLVIIFILAALVGGIILGVAYGNQLQEEISSIGFMPHYQAVRPAAKQPAANVQNAVIAH
jgi:uncharacterized membrane protein YfcA